jgi:hypothetical protein
MATGVLAGRQIEAKCWCGNSSAFNLHPSFFVLPRIATDIDSFELRLDYIFCSEPIEYRNMVMTLYRKMATARIDEGLASALCWPLRWPPKQQGQDYGQWTMEYRF